MSAVSAQKSPLVLLLLGSVCISFSPVFIRLAKVAPDIAGFYRMLFAALSLLLLILLRGRGPVVAKKPMVLLLLGGVLLSVDFMCWHRSIYLVGPGVSTLLANCQVFFTALFAWLVFKEEISSSFLFAMVMAVVGLGMITGIGWAEMAPGYRLGVLLGLLTALFYSGYLLFLKEAMKTASVDGMVAMLIVTLAGLVVLGATGGLSGASFVIPDKTTLLVLAGVGVISTTIGWTLISSAVRYVPATLAGLVLLLQPALAFAWDVLFFARPTGSSEVLGVMLVLCGIYIGSWRKQIIQK